MKKTILTLCMALAAMLTLNAAVTTYSGTTIVTAYGSTQSSMEGGVSVTTGDNGLDEIKFVVAPFSINNLLFESVPRATADGMTVYSAEREVVIGFEAPTRAILLARIVDGMMTANVNLPEKNITIYFDNVGDHFQLPNSDMEAWNSSTGEPTRWHGFKSAGGTFSGISAGLVKLEQSNDVRSGATGYSAVMTANSLGIIVANGTMTNGKLMAGAMSAASTLNHAEMDKANGTEDFYMPLYAKPDKFNVWLKYTQGTPNANNKANVSVKTFDGTYYQEPEDKVYTNLSGSIVGGQIPAGDWTHYSFNFDYESYAANGASSEAIFVTFSTNGNPGEGSKDDALYVDDMELVYLGSMTDLRYKGVTIDGWDPAVTSYNMVIDGEPNLDDFAATIEGASAVLAKSMEQIATGTYRIALTVVSADLQTATSYVINASAATALAGDVDGDGHVNIADVTALIDYLLAGGNIDTQAADMDGNSNVNIADVTALIDKLLGGN